MKHIDLFSGIGGFAYAIDQVWDNVEHIFCEVDEYCQQVLKKHWKGSEIYGDIRSITADTIGSGHIHGKPKEQSAKPGQQAQRKPEPGVRPPFILTGGFPCQPFSQAGVRRGTSDERYLWPEMLRVIRLSKPEWVIAENVRGILTLQEGVVFEQVCLDLEESGYTVQPFIIPAVAVNAPHRRDRVWFVGHAEHNGQHGSEDIKSSEQRSNGNSQGQDELRQSKRTDSLWEDASDTGQQHGRQRGIDQQRQKTTFGASQTENTERYGWEADWMEVAAEFCSVDDGLPAEVGDFTLSKAGHRKEQLKAYGNAIVPQVALEILKGIKES